MTRLSQTSGLLSAASRGKVELIIEKRESEPHAAAGTLANQTHHPFTSEFPGFEQRS